MLEKLQLARAKKNQRIEAGCDPVVAGWQCFLEEMLIQLENYLVAGQLVTFQNLTDEEKELFWLLQQQLTLPDAVCAVFIPPSVLQGMLGGQVAQSDHPSADVPDSGIVLAIHCGRYDLIVNTLFARQPYTPGIDVYENGKLLAGYSFQTQAECRKELPGVIRTFLDRIDNPI